MNRKSQLHKLLEYNPILNPNSGDFFFDTSVSDDLAIMQTYNTNQIWSWTIPEGKDIISSGYWRFDRNLYLITEKPVPEDKVYPKHITFVMLPRDFKYLDTKSNIIKSFDTYQMEVK